MQREPSCSINLNLIVKEGFITIERTAIFSGNYFVAQLCVDLSSQMADSFSPGQVWFKPLDSLQINVGESLLTVCVPPMGCSILTGGETLLIYCAFKPN
jgi:hypothetical protein